MNKNILYIGLVLSSAFAQTETGKPSDYTSTQHEERITLKNIDGRTANLYVTEVKAEGLVVQSAPSDSPVLIKWEKLDLDDLKKNNPKLDQLRLIKIDQKSQGVFSDYSQSAQAKTLAQIKIALGESLAKVKIIVPSQVDIRIGGLNRVQSGQDPSVRSALDWISDMSEPEKINASRKAFVAAEGLKKQLPSLGSVSDKTIGILETAKKQSLELPATAEARTFKITVESVLAILQELKVNPAANSADWTKAFGNLAKELKPTQK